MQIEVGKSVNSKIKRTRDLPKGSGISTEDYVHMATVIGRLVEVQIGIVWRYALITMIAELNIYQGDKHGNSQNILHN
jgi:hypothetical protein